MEAKKKLAVGILAIFLLAGVAGVFASGPIKGSGALGSWGLPERASPNGEAFAERAEPAADDGQSPGVQELSTTIPGWQQVNSNGFGDSNADEVTALEPFDGYLYAGTHNPVNDARIFRSPDGVTWTAVTEPGFGNSHDIAPPAILDLAVFNGKLYASTGRGNASQIWRTQNGTIWAPMDVTGFSDPDNVAITTLAEYSGKIYAGVTNDVNGAQIWSSFTGDNNSWTQVGPESPGSAPASVTALTVFSDTLYAAIEPESDAPLQIWRSYGGSVWTTVISDGFGDSDNTKSGGMVVYGDYMYLGGGNAASGAQLWRSSDGENWTAAITPAFGDSNNQTVESVFVFQNQLHASVKNAVTGIEIWRWTDGTLWEQTNPDGFGDSNNTGTNSSNATADILGHLYLGTSNTVAGGELWRKQHPYDVDLSQDEAKSGTAGQNVIYTVQITNTGTMTDTFDLIATGNNWTTAVSTSTITLNPGAGDLFSVTVSIPSGALGNDSEQVTITATSQGNAARRDSAQLTTTVLPVYGVNLSPDDTLGGLPDKTVTYTLTISNSGNVTDTFYLAFTGNAWATFISSPSIVLAPNASGVFTVAVNIPADALGGDADSTTITATSRGDGAKSATTILTTNVISVYGIDLSGDDSLTGYPGRTVTYTMWITNSGNSPDMVDIEASGNGWQTVLSTPSLALAVGERTSFTISVSIPSDTTDLENDKVTITARSKHDAKIEDTASLTTINRSLPEKIFLPVFILG